MTRTRTGHALGLLLALALGLAVAACSGGKPNGVASLGGDKATTTTVAAGGGSRLQRAVAFARCLRQHGVNVPDPRMSGGNILQDLGDNDDNDPKFKAAQEACRQHQPSGARGQRRDPQEQQRMLAFARCLRQHGINVPDPQFRGNDVIQQLPRGLDPEDPEFRAAQQACQRYQPNRGERSSGGAGK